ncbi:MAG: hypothetical protein M1838_000146 [Thelocarpon superellum]|nr:MAG: hypothetical protein M1838_000146 [Thelocarpon superellum]
MFTSSEIEHSPLRGLMERLRDTLESEAIPNVLFDVRNDSDALFSHFQIDLKGVQDMQLIELATRPFHRKFVNSLAKCIEEDAALTYGDKERWKSVKETGTRLFDPNVGGSYDVFNARPLSEAIKIYSVQDVVYLPTLWGTYSRKLSKEWWAKVLQESQARVALSQTATYQSSRRHKALGPWR